MIQMIGQSVPLSKFPGDTKLSGIILANMPNGHDYVRKDLNRLEKLASRKFMEFNKGNCKVLYLARNNLMQ